MEKVGQIVFYMGRRVRKHGLSKSPEYHAWKSMWHRCYLIYHKSYMSYGFRGIRVNSRWKCFKNFIKDMGPKPTSKHTLERIDNNKGYSMKNCKWALMSEQSANKRNNVRIEIDGKSKILAEWLREYKISTSTYYKRLNKHRMSPIDALTSPIKHKRAVPKVSQFLVESQKNPDHLEEL